VVFKEVEQGLRLQLPPSFVELWVVLRRDDGLEPELLLLEEGVVVAVASDIKRCRVKEDDRGREQCMRLKNDY